MISIIIVTKDRQTYIDRQLVDIFRQLRGTSIDFEVLVFDDGSSTPITVDGDAMLVRSDTNLGLIEARNQAARYVSDRSEYLFFLDDDLFVFNLPVYLMAAVSEISDKCVGVSLPYINLPTHKYEEISTFSHLYDVAKSDDDVVYFFGGTSVFSKKVFDDIGGLEGKYYIYLEEEDLALRLYVKGLKLKVLYGLGSIGIHDQAPGKNWEDRRVYLLSNRMLFHYKFVRNRFLKYTLNALYIALYLFKSKSLDIVDKSRKRYEYLKGEVSPVSVSTPQFIRFMVKRYFNV